MFKSGWYPANIPYCVRVAGTRLYTQKGIFEVSSDIGVPLGNDHDAHERVEIGEKYVSLTVTYTSRIKMMAKKLPLKTGFTLLGTTYGISVEQRWATHSRGRAIAVHISRQNSLEASSYRRL